jgi:hypothetical protein
MSRMVETRPMYKKLWRIQSLFGQRRQYFEAINLRVIAADAAGVCLSDQRQVLTSLRHIEKNSLRILFEIQAEMRRTTGLTIAKEPISMLIYAVSNSRNLIERIRRLGGVETEETAVPASHHHHNLPNLIVGIPSRAFGPDLEDILGEIGRGHALQIED